MTEFKLGDIVDIDGIPDIYWEIVIAPYVDYKGGEVSVRVKFWGVFPGMNMAEHTQRRLKHVGPEETYLVYVKDLIRTNEMLVLALAGEDTTYRFPERA